MASTTSVNKALEKIIDELDYVKNGINDGEAKDDLLKWVDDVQSAIDNAINEFEEYSDEVANIEDDSEGLVKRLNEVIQ